MLTLTASRVPSLKLCQQFPSSYKWNSKTIREKHKLQVLYNISVTPFLNSSTWYQISVSKLKAWQNFGIVILKGLKLQYGLGWFVNNKLKSFQLTIMIHYSITAYLFTVLASGALSFTVWSWVCRDVQLSTLQLWVACYCRHCIQVGHYICYLTLKFFNSLQIHTCTINIILYTV